MREHIEDFLRRYPRLAEQGGADNQCRIATDALVAELSVHAITATGTWVRGHRITPKSPTRRAMTADRHQIARLPDASFVDVTRRQFDPEAEHPTYYASEAELARDWSEIDRGPPDGPAEEENWEGLGSSSG